MKDVNLILVNIDRFYSEHLLEEMEKIKNIKYVLVCDVKEPRKKYKFDYDFINIENIHYGEYGMNLSEAEVVEEKIQKNFLKLETLIFKMMDRGEKPSKLVDYHIKEDQKFRDKISFSRAELDFGFRRILFNRHLRFWSNILKKKKINFFYSTTVPHIVWDFIVFELCKLKKIPAIFCPISMYEGCFIPCENVSNNFESIKMDYKKNLKIFKHKKIKLSHFAAKYFSKMTSKKISKPHWTEQSKEAFVYKKQYNKFNLLTKIIFYFLTGNMTLFRKHLITNYYEQKFYKKLNYQNKFLKSKFDLMPKKNKIIFFPLHCEPESATVPMGGYKYFDQLEVIDNLAFYAKKNNFTIVIKEHPFQKSLSRSYEYYKEILKNKNICFVDTNTDSFTIIKQSDIVATITGSAGWEALFLGKQVICFGETILKVAPSVFYPKSYNDLDRFLREFKTQKITHFELKVFLKTIEKYSIEAFNEPFTGISFFKENKVTPKSVSTIFIKNMKFYLKKYKKIKSL